MINYFITNELFLEVNNRTGLTAAVVDILTKAGVLIESFAAHSYCSMAYMYLVTDDNEQAIAELEQLSDVRTVNENQVLFFEKNNWSDQTWSNIATALCNNNIEIDHFYSTATRQTPYFVLSTLDNHRAADCVSTCV